MKFARRLVAVTPPRILLSLFCLMGTTALPVHAEAQTVSGTVTLEGCVNSAQSVTFAFFSTTQSRLFTRTVTLNSDGSYTLSDLPPDHYRVKIKGAKWLAAVSDLDTTLGNVIFSPFLGAGDAYNTNSVDSSSFGALINAFGGDASIPGSGYDPTCDFNCDGKNDSSDFALCIGNFGATGANMVEIYGVPLFQVGEYRMISQKGGVGTAVNTDGTVTRRDYAPWIGPYFGCGMVANSSLSLTGKITTTFQWQPRQFPDANFGGLDDPTDSAPQDVVVYEWCEAGGLSGTLPLGSCDNGIAGGQIFDGGGTFGGNIDSYGEQYQVKQGGKAVVLTRSPSVTVSVGVLVDNVKAAIQYGAAVYPIRLDFTGLTKDPVADSFLPPSNVLIGQGVTGILSIGTYQGGSSGAWLSNYLWAVPGKTFASYVVAPDASNAVLNPLTTAITNSATPHWHWAQEGAETVTGSADVYARGSYSSANPPPDPPFGVNPLPLSPVNLGRIAQTRNITVEKPDAYFVPTIASNIYFGNDPFSGNQTLYTGSQSNPAIDVQCWVRTPSKYWLKGNDPLDEYGRFHTTQLINQNHAEHRLLYNPILSNTNGEIWLDNAFSYGDEKPANPRFIVAWPKPFFPQEGVEDKDFPEHDVVSSVATEIIVNDQYYMYLMYLPPGDANWVPLYWCGWQWQSDFLGNSNGNWYPHQGTTSAVTEGWSVVTHDHPVWSHRLVNSKD